MDASSALYPTAPLQSKTSTRLLTLHRGSGADEIRCSLTAIDLDTKPRYEALSYCWGLPDNAKQVLVGGYLVDVRENLWSALWHLRLADVDRILWIDALCIDQKNVLERNHQVRLMGSIYSKAFKVLSWLGPASATSDVAMEYLATVFRSNKPTAEQSKAVIELCGREYWQRMWILQEFGLASDIILHYGSKTVHWGALEFYFTKKENILFNNDTVNAVVAVGSVIEYRKIRSRQHNDDHTLIFLLGVFNTRKCADPRDTVFALLGMASDCGGSTDQMAVKVDYSQSLFSTYTNVFKAAIRGKWGKTTTLRIKTYQDVLLLYLECFTAAYPDINGRSKPLSVKSRGPISAFYDWEGNKLIAKELYKEAQSSLKVCDANSGLKGVLRWLESPCDYGDTNALEGFRRWPLEFPDAGRQLAKLQLLIAVYGPYSQQDRIKMTFLEEFTEILVSPISGRPQSIQVDNETGVIKVLWKAGDIESSGSNDSP